MKTSRILFGYFGLAYFISWLFFILLILNRQGLIFLFADNPQNARTLDIWHAFGGLGPFLAAIVTILLFQKKRGVAGIFQCLFPQ